jgi:hypothetical protein
VRLQASLAVFIFMLMNVGGKPWAVSSGQFCGLATTRSECDGREGQRHELPSNADPLLASSRSDSSRD